MTISQTKVRRRRLPGKPGQPYDSSNLNEETNFTNSNPQAKQSDIITVDSAANETDYAYSVNGVEVKITSGESATVAAIATALADAHNATPEIRGQVKATASADEVTLEATYPGVKYEVDEDDANLSLATGQAAAEADPIPFGVLCIRGGASSVSPYPNRLGRVASSAGLVPQSVTLTHGGDSAAVVKLRIDHDLYEASGATAAALVTAINNAVPANSVTATADGSDVTIEVDTAGDGFKLVGYSGDISLSSEERGDHLADIAIGISRFAYDEEVGPNGEAHYPANAGGVAMQRGRIYVESQESVTEADPVFVQLTGDNAGRLYKTRATGRAYLTGRCVRWYADRSEDGLNIVSCNFI